MATRKTLANRLGVSVSTIRSWERQFSERLVSPPAKRGFGQQKVFAADDVRLLMTIARLRDEHMSMHDIRAVLDEEIEQTPFEPETVEETVSQAQERERGSLVPVSQFTEVALQLKDTAGRLDVVVEERDRLRERVDVLTDDVTRISAEKASVEAELNVTRRYSRAVIIAAAVLLLAVVALGVLVALTG